MNGVNRVFKMILRAASREQGCQNEIPFWCAFCRSKEKLGLLVYIWLNQ